jgi:hypothetical protein
VSLSDRKFRDHVVTRAFKAARKTARTCYSQRDEERRATERRRARTKEKEERERERERERGRAIHAHKRTYRHRTTVDANNERGTPVFSGQHSVRNPRKENRRNGGEETRRNEEAAGKNADEKRGGGGGAGGRAGKARGGPGTA